jgi:hypothetical protein
LDHLVFSVLKLWYQSFKLSLFAEISKRLSFSLFEISGQRVTSLGACENAIFRRCASALRASAVVRRANEDGTCAWKALWARSWRQNEGDRF